MPAKQHLATVGLIVGPVPCVIAQVPREPASAPNEVRQLVGTDTGQWTMFGLGPTGEVIKRMTWTDTMRAEKPEVQTGRAYVTTRDEMSFEGNPRPVTVTGKEGYLMGPDGRLRDYFIKIAGQVQWMVKLADNVWTYSSPAPAEELARLGFQRGASGTHVLVKVVTQENGKETHRISRVTTVTWKQDGSDRVLQFVSLQGYHQRGE